VSFVFSLFGAWIKKVIFYETLPVMESMLRLVFSWMGLDFKAFVSDLSFIPCKRHKRACFGGFWVKY